jgi:hypothetical protein
MRKVNPILLCGLLLATTNLLAQSPGGISQQSVWLQGKVSPSAVKQQTLNFNPVIIPDDSKANMLPGQVPSKGRLTVFTVYQTPASDNEAAVWEIKGANDLTLSTKQVSSKSGKTNLDFAKGRSLKGEAVLLAFTGNAGSQSEMDAANYMQLAPPNSASVSEVILYERRLNAEEIAKVETYLALKYGITLLNNYVNAQGDVIWNYKKDSVFSNNIAGIGRDDKSTLYQKQSTSSTSAGQLIIGAENIAALNSKNAAELSNGNYLIWGDNGQSFTPDQNVQSNENKLALAEKKWLMRRTGNNADKINTELRVDTKTMLTGSSNEFYLIIDRSGTGEFASQSAAYIKPDEISKEGIAIFKNIHWDTDGSGRDAFTFGVKPAVLIVKNKDAANLVSFQLYPNPVREGIFKMALTLDKTSDIEIRIYDMHQRLVHSAKASGQSSYLFTGTVKGAAGSYTVRVITPQTEYSRIIIVQ